MPCVRVTSLSPAKKSLSETGVRRQAGIISDMMLGRQFARILSVLRVQSFSITTNPLRLPYSIGEPVAR